VLGNALVEDAPPHPLSRHRPTRLSASNICKRRFFEPKKQRAIVSADPENSELELRRYSAVFVEVVTVSVVEATVPDGVAVGGEKLQDIPEGNPEQTNETVELNPLSGVIEIVDVPLCPPLMESDAGEAATEKPCERLMTYVALATRLLEKPLATAIAWINADPDTVIGPL
jgi:hypothetical protein